MHHPSIRRTLRLGILPMAVASALNAQTTWDGGAADTNINSPDNWNNNTLPALNGTVGVTFGTGGSGVTMNTDASFTTVTLNRAGDFTFLPGAPGGALILRSLGTSSSQNFIVSTTAGGTQTIDAPLMIDTTNQATTRLLVIGVNSTSRTLDINGAISRTPASTGDFAMRFYGAAGSTTRIDGPISNMTGFQQAFTNTWGGNFVFGGSRASTATLTIASAGTGANPATTARLVLGETPADVQSWGNITLNNTIKLVIGGTVSATGLTSAGNATAANTRIVGASAQESTLSLPSATIGTTMTIGGTGENENNVGITKTGSGLMTLGGTHTYTGTTRVSAGTLSMTGSLASPIVVEAGATLSGEGTTTGSLTFAPGVSTLQFNPATEPASLIAASLATTGATVVVSPTATVDAGLSYTVLRLSGSTFTGSPTAIFAASSRGATLSYANGNTDLVYTGGSAAAVDLVWRGDDATNPTYWDTVATANWRNAGSPERFYSGDNVRFDDTATTSNIVVQGSSLQAGNMVFDNSALDYTISGGALAGSGSLTKSGSGSVFLTQSGTNTFSGPLNLNGGTLSISSLNQIGGSTSTRPISFNGGELEFTGLTATTNTLPVSVGAGGATISVTRSITGGDGSVTYQTLRLGAPITGSGAIVKTGQSILAIGQNSATTLGNTFDGPIQVDAGVLDIRNPDSLGATTAGTTVNSAMLALFPFNQNQGVTFDAEPITFTGASFLRSQNEDDNSDIINTLTGPVTLADGATLGVSSYRAVTLSSGVVTGISSNASRLILSGPVSLGAGSTLALGSASPQYVASAIRNSNAAQDIIISGTLTGTGSVSANGAGSSVFEIAAPAYSGDTTVTRGLLTFSAPNLSGTSSTVTLAETGAILDLSFSGSMTVSKLFVGTTQLDAGTYKAPGSTESGTELAQLSGTGTLVVTSGPIVATPYELWAGAFGLTGDDALPGADFDKDNLSNLFEYATGSSPVSAGSAAIKVELVGSFLRLSFNRVNDPSLRYTVEGSSDLLGAWSSVVDVLGVNPVVGGTAGEVSVIDTVAMPTGGRRFLRLVVTQP